MQAARPADARMHEAAAVRSAGVGRSGAPVFHITELSHVSTHSGDRPGRTVRTAENDRRRGGRRQERLARRNDQPAGRLRRAGARRLCHHGARLPRVPAARRAGRSASQARLATLDIDDVRALAEAGAQIRQLDRSTRRSRRRCEAAIRAQFDAPDARQPRRVASRCARRPRPKTCPMPRSPASRRPSSTSSGIDEVLHKMKEVFASLYNDRAISYRVHKGFAHADVALSAGVQRMVRSDLGAAGVMFTIDTESRLHGRGLHHLELRPGRDGGAGRRQPGRVLRAQADAARRQARRSSAAASAPS